MDTATLPLGVAAHAEELCHQTVETATLPLGVAAHVEELCNWAPVTGTGARALSSVRPPPSPNAFTGAEGSHSLLGQELIQE